ncbi:mitochondrial dicarboxylate carrier [Drosophila ficusphila]|uniref:mitochondrial dicarboxylate carrier n=1 Tax=Drosophila ficusphila TaxID=30025 RepID=UPI001C89B5B1|nr:mitochondrial dicarboxylate carrier [Drosophila ficusphila]
MPFLIAALQVWKLRSREKEELAQLVRTSGQQLDSVERSWRDSHASTCFGQTHKSIHSLACQINPNRKSPLRDRKKKIDGHTSRKRYKVEKVADRTRIGKLAIIHRCSHVENIEPEIIPRWWSGGVAGAFAQFFTAPFDLIESRMVVSHKDVGMASSLRSAVRKHGFFSLYDGLSAQLLRQLTYTTLRFHLYEVGKDQMEDPVDWLDKIFVAGLAGCTSGMVGIPTELINTRMQVNRVLPKRLQWNYRHVFHGLYRVTKDEGWRALFRGCLFAFVRSGFVTIGQNGAYDQAKETYMELFKMKHDDTFLHLISSVTAACICVPIVQPIENLRTLAMVDSSGLTKAMGFMMRFGLRGLFRGMVPCLLRMVPNTIITFLTFEQIRVRFGYYEIEELSS